MKAQVKRFSDFTKHNKIFKGSYWGMSEGDVEHNIIENRNKFVDEFQVKNRVVKPPKYIKNYYNVKNTEQKLDDCDHVEVYKTLDNKYLILNNPYNSEDTSSKLVEKGWSVTDGLYSNSAGVSYYKIVNQRQ